MPYVPLFGNLPARLVTKVAGAQQQLEDRLLATSAYLWLVESRKDPGGLMPRRRARRLRGKRLATIMRLRRMRDDLRELIKARSLIWTTSDTLMPLTPDNTALRLQLRVIRAYMRFWKAHLRITSFLFLSQHDQEHTKAVKALEEYYRLLDERARQEEQETEESVLSVDLGFETSDSESSINLW